MPSKNSKQTVQKTETPETKVTTPTQVVETAAPKQKGGKKVEAAAPVVATAAAPTPAVEAPKQKGGKKAAAPPAATPVKDTAPAKEAPTQKGGKKAAAAAPAKEVAKVEAEVPKQKGGKKAAAPAKEVAEAPKQKGGKKAAVKKEEVVEDAEDGEAEGDRRIRSFKVRLPNKEEFEGRFTGLTPYQAANKALSKYYRETETPLVEVTFSICESTRKSKKSVYTYVGKRLKLEVPVTYQIQDGRQIVKNFKNSLKKVKKSESTTTA
jgi:hypothetical protein